ncbi:MAG: c-type cytochrome [Jhaorihella sp.]
MPLADMPWNLVKFCALAAAALIAVAAFAADGESNRFVRKRTAAMYAAQAALDRLGDMSAGRRRFDASAARQARRDLVALARAVPGLFRRPRMDPQSRALPGIWSRWQQFRDAAQRAERAARDLNVSSLNRMRQGLPKVVHTCLDCHRSFREPP